jgi:hypothetical protein
MHVTSVTTEAAQEAERERERETGDGEGERGSPPSGGGARRKILVTFAVGLVLIGVGVAVAVAQAPARVVRIGYPGIKAVNQNGVSVIGFTVGQPTICQAGENLPAGISAIRLSLWSFYGPPVHLTVYGGSRVLTAGSRGTGWIGDSVTVPVRSLARTSSSTKVCFSLQPNTEPILILGANTPQRRAASFQEDGTNLGEGGSKLLNGRVTLEYLSSSHRSWFSQALAVGRHAGLGRALSGTWIALVIVLLMLAVGGLALRLTLREAP